MHPLPPDFDSRGIDPKDVEVCPVCEGEGCQDCGFTGTLKGYQERKWDCNEDYDRRVR